MNNHTYIFLPLSEIVITYTFVYAAPTYETATTRKFRYGRTETLRQGFIEFDTEYNRWSTPEREFCGDNSSFFNFFKNFQ